MGEVFKFVSVISGNDWYDGASPTSNLVRKTHDSSTFDIRILLDKKPFNYSQ